MFEFWKEWVYGDEDLGGNWRGGLGFGVGRVRVVEELVWIRWGSVEDGEWYSFGGDERGVWYWVEYCIWDWF